MLALQLDMNSSQFNVNSCRSLPVLGELEAIGGLVVEIGGVLVLGSEETPSTEIFLGLFLEIFAPQSDPTPLFAARSFSLLQYIIKKNLD